MTGAECYSPRVLRAYDFLVLSVSARWLWGCPAERILQLYDDNVSGNHLDVGVGTGYFLDRCQFPTASPRVSLLDLNPNSLEFTARRIARYHPTIHCADVLNELPVLGSFDSVGLNFLLHCLPGAMSAKCRMFAHLKPSLRPGCVIFGSTVLGKGVDHSAAGRAVMALYNQRGIFGNREDERDALEEGLRAHFSEVETMPVGRVALFRARVPASAGTST